MSLVTSLASDDETFSRTRRSEDEQHCLGQSTAELVSSLLGTSSLYPSNDFEPKTESELEEVLRPQIDELGVRGKFSDAADLGTTYLLSALQRWGERDTRSIRSLENLSSFLMSQGELSHSIILLEKVVQLREDTQGSDHPDTLASQASQVAAYVARGQQDKAELYGTELLEKCKSVLGSDNEATTRTMANLGFIYVQKGDFVRAETLYSNLYDIRSRTLDEYHPDLIRTMVNLSNVYAKLERWKDAASMASDALDRRRELMGDDHDMTAGIADSLLTCYVNGEMWDDAIPHLEYVLRVLRRTVGPQDPSFISMTESYRQMLLKAQCHIKLAKLQLLQLTRARNAYGQCHRETLQHVLDLINTYCDLQYWADADRQTANVMSISPDHAPPNDRKDYLIATTRVGECFARREEWKRAEKVLSQTVSWTAETLGETSLESISAMQILAVVYSKLKCPDEVEWLQLKIRKGTRSRFGENSARYRLALTQLIDTYSRDGRWDEAEELAMENLALHRQNQDTQEKDLLKALITLGRLYQNSEQWERFEPVGREILELATQLYGPAHSDTIGHMANLASNLRGQDRLEEALQQYKQVVRLRVENPDTSPIPLYTSRGNLGRCYVSLERLDDAAEELTLASEGLAGTLGPSHVETLHNLESLAHVLEKQGHSVEAGNAEGLPPIQKEALLLLAARRNQFKVVPSRHFGVRTSDLNWRLGGIAV